MFGSFIFANLRSRNKYHFSGSTEVRLLCRQLKRKISLSGALASRNKSWSQKIPPLYGPSADALLASEAQLKKIAGKRKKTSYLIAKYFIGFTGFEPLRSSKCNCGWFTVPDLPDLAINCPRETLSPRFTSNLLLCA